VYRVLKEFLVKGKRFGLVEARCYRFASEEEAKDEKIRTSVNCDTLEEQNSRPTALVLEKGRRKDRPNQGTVDS